VKENKQKQLKGHVYPLTAGTMFAIDGQEKYTVSATSETLRTVS